MRFLRWLCEEPDDWTVPVLLKHALILCALAVIIFGLVALDLCL